ncbi:MAG TPA: Asp-tRNA(Asn)/Glu-tRNA(Gln) amidotransferase subunit GatC [Candidatus Saccharimonadales bacterium]|nr:Asp-tRNA(Asn)/Glu-tRNA(Gln) amidotransferase subunit GatC [Candidatus Saccharimonadales bacterium]
MKLNIKHVAKLANLPITPEEEKTLETQLTETLNYVEMLSEIDTKDIQPTAHVTGLENVTRDDQTMPSLTQSQALSNSNKTHNGLFIVDAILENA